MPDQRPKLLYLVTEDWYFWSHRLPMARAARDAGFEVVVATRVNDHTGRIEGEGFRVIPLAWRRRSLNPAAALVAIAGIATVYRRERPDVVHHVAVKPVLFGGLAAALAGVPAVVGALTGLGSSFVASGAKAKLAGMAIRPVLRWLMRRPGAVMIVQNGDDRRLLVDQGLVPADRIRIIRGSGVDLAHYRPLPEPAEGPVTFAFVGRLLADKGLRTLVEAHRRLRAEGLDVALLIAGAADRENPTAIPQEELDRWAVLPGVTLAGHVADVREVWAKAHAAVQPSRPHMEGLPKSLLEAAACGRPIVTTDVPGCREITRDGGNGLLVPHDDPAALAAAMRRIAQDADLRARFGAASRAMVESDLSAEAVGAAVAALYRSLLPEPAAAPSPAVTAAAP